MFSSENMNMSVYSQQGPRDLVNVRYNAKKHSEAEGNTNYGSTDMSALMGRSHNRGQLTEARQQNK